MVLIVDDVFRARGATVKKRGFARSRANAKQAKNASCDEDTAREDMSMPVSKRKSTLKRVCCFSL